MGEGSLPEEMDGRGVRQFGSRLRPVSDATTVQVRNGEVLLSDGPAAAREMALSDET